MPETPTTPDVNINVKRQSDSTWRIIERVGVASFMLVVLGYHFMSQDSSKQDYIQKQADANSQSIKEQARLDREEEKLRAQFIQEKLISVVETQVKATVEATVATQESRAANEQTAETNVKVVEALGKFNQTAEELVDAFKESSAK